MQNQNNPQALTVKDGWLWLGDRLLLVRYSGGDCDTIDWPLVAGKKRNLYSALYDMREMGELIGDTVTLPNGTPYTLGE